MAFVFNFSSPSEGDPAVKEVSKLMGRAGAVVVSVSVDRTVTKVSGIPTRGYAFTFADSQTVLLNTKAPGDVWQVKINGKVTPIRAQSDKAGAVKEIAARLAAGRSKFQADLAKTRVELPPSVKVSRATMLEKLTTRRDELRADVASATAELAALEAQAA